jgi:hypothetical protein
MTAIKVRPKCRFCGRPIYSGPECVACTLDRLQPCPECLDGDGNVRRKFRKQRCPCCGGKREIELPEPPPFAVAERKAEAELDSINTPRQ